MFISRLFLAVIVALPIQAQCGAQAVFSHVDVLLKHRQYENAAKALKPLKHCAGLSPLQRFETGWLLGRSRHFKDALDLFGTVPQDVPDVITHNYAVALSEFELEDYRGASDVLKNLRSQAGFDAKCANLLAVAYSKQNLYKEAYAILAQEIQENPGDLSAYLNMITACAEGGDMAKAATVASEAKRLFPQSGEVLVVRGAANMLLGHLEEAQKDFASAVSLAPSEAEPHFFLALAEYKEAHYAEAADVLRSAIDAKIADSDLHYLLAECLLKIDPVDSAAVTAQLDRAIQQNGKSVSARTLRGRLLLDAGQAKSAIADLQLATQLDPRSRSAVYNLARAYRAAGRAPEAQALFERLRSEKGDTLTELGERRLNQTLTQSSPEKAR
jgi:tetratricopeptide (TPR) repeat protein